MFSEKTRRILRNVFRGVGAAAVSLTFQACYGTPPDTGDDTAIRGVVKSKTSNKGIPGIKVSAAFGEDADPVEDMTDSAGYFSIYAPKADRYELTFEDIDGNANGLFKKEMKTITSAQVGGELDVVLEELEEKENAE
jgi:hypothetical protein